MLQIGHAALVIEMKIEKLNPWLNFIGNLAILFGLIAVAIEIRDNSAAVRAQELGAITDLNIERKEVSE